MQQESSIIQPRISIIINTFNAEKHLEKVLEATKDFDEVIVCDMHSEDETQNLARKFGARIVLHERCNICEPARNYAIQSANNPWVLIIDADEIVTKELKDFLYSLIQKENPPAAIRIPRKNFFMGRFMNCLYPDYVTRFARKDSINWPALIHSQPIITGRIEEIDSHHQELALIHLAENTISDRLKKTNIYTDQEVVRRGNRRYNFLALLIKPFGRFFHTYFLKKGYRDGKEGFIYASLNAIYKFVTLIKQEEESNENRL